MALAIGHIILHWSVIFHFVSGTEMHPRGHRLEGVAMLILVIALLTTAILDLPPSSWLVGLNEFFKQVDWEPKG